MQQQRNWRVAVVGSGPAGLYATEALVKRGAHVDVFERLFAPFGLVRYGVAPDHQKIKKTAVVFERILDRPEVRFFGNVTVGRDLTVPELQEHYDQVLIAMGSSAARRLGIVGEELPGSIAATDFVNWYNGHPEHVDFHPPLDGRVAVVVGMGNVAIDVARVLLREREVLEKSDIAPHALEVLCRGSVQEVVLLARRGPDQSAFDVKEVRDLQAMSDVAVTRAGYEGKVETNKGRFVMDLPPEDLTARRKIVFRFCASPVELRGRQRVEQVRIERNDLVQSAARVRAVGTGKFEEIEAGLVIRAIGYQGIPLDGLPFHEDMGIIPNDDGRVLRDPGGERIPDVYVTGWIKRGPTGLIGTNKSCALETVKHMEHDLSHLGPARDPDAALALLSERNVSVIDWRSWKRLDEYERTQGSSQGRVRNKILSLHQALDVLKTSTRAQAGADEPQD